MPTMLERLRVIATQLWMYDGPYEAGIQTPALALALALAQA